MKENALFQRAGMPCHGLGACYSFIRAVQGFKVLL